MHFSVVCIRFSWFSSLILLLQISLSISGGTCFLEAASNDTQVVRIIQHPEGVHCTNLVVGVMGLGTALVAVHDIGLSPSTVASATV